MLQNIRQIGIFMVAAQAVVHFAPGRQYEKYIKSISGVIILLLFLKPFVQMAGGEWRTPSAVLDGAEETARLPVISAGFQLEEGIGPEAELKRRVEEEMAAGLNRELAGSAFGVRQVELNLEEKAGDFEDASGFTVEIVMGERAADDARITVEEISVGRETEPNKEAVLGYRRRFAELLKIEEERVEVRWDGRD